METWRNGDNGAVVKKVIEGNFNVLFKNLSKHMMSLSTTERETLSKNYLSKGLRVFDTTLNKWFVYDGSKWLSTFIYKFEIKKDDWKENSIYIPYTTHLIESPIVQLSIKISNSYHIVWGGVEIDSDNNITISTDIPFEGRIEIK